MVGDAVQCPRVLVPRRPREFRPCLNYSRLVLYNRPFPRKRNGMQLLGVGLPVAEMGCGRRVNVLRLMANSWYLTVSLWSGDCHAADESGGSIYLGQLFVQNASEHL